ncbi:helix-turn-helix protein [Blastococcus colisei]|uniref:Helix-turn-helix protein n=1 Tax=Blastococcus colisei TaxID=1564162 RepID=A0A543PC07_9ACTN|nr:helix-turn-helix domain-containing protein [Blastococcus colisei]TQN41623.1 helix-turn-helix protein [Blastococcus colisei]
MGRPRMPKEIERRFWRLIAAGSATEQAAEAVGVSADTGQRWFRDGGGMAPMALTEPSDRFLTVAERETIDLCWAEGWPQADIAREIGRHPSTVSRELRRNRLEGYPRRPPLPVGQRHRPGPAPGTQGPGRRPRLRYRAAPAQAKAEARGRRPKPSKIAEFPELQAYVQRQLKEGWSPEQITGRLVVDFLDDERMRISHEAIYQALFVQGRGGLNRELTKHLRTGRALRKPRRRVCRRRVKSDPQASDES